MSSEYILHSDFSIVSSQSNLSVVFYNWHRKIDSHCHFRACVFGIFGIPYYIPQ